MADILKYYAGAKPGKRNKPDATQNESANKRNSLLHYDSGKNEMKCTACSKFYVERLNSLKENAKMWIIGTSNFKIDTIKSHESSTMHTDSVKASINIHKSEAGRAIKMLTVCEICSGTIARGYEKSCRSILVDFNLALLSMINSRSKINLKVSDRRVICICLLTACARY